VSSITSITVLFNDFGLYLYIFTCHRRNHWLAFTRNPWKPLLHICCGMTVGGSFQHSRRTIQPISRLRISLEGRPRPWFDHETLGILLLRLGRKEHQRDAVLFDISRLRVFFASSRLQMYKFWYLWRYLLPRTVCSLHTCRLQIHAFTTVIKTRLLPADRHECLDARTRNQGV